MIIFLSALLLLCGCSARAPKVKNSDFSDGLSGWEFNAYDNSGAEAEAVSEDGRGGVAFISADKENDVRLIQELAVSPNTAYCITCSVRTEGVEGGAGANIGVYGVPVTSEMVFDDADWTEVELIGKTAPGQKAMLLSVGIGSHGSLSSGKAWFDEIRIEKYPGTYNGANVFGTGAQSEDKTDDQLTEFPTAQIILWSFIATAFMMLLWFWHFRSARKPLSKEKVKAALPVILILLGALIVRVALSLIFYGHRTDINCFTQWGKRLVENGAAHFYDDWCDYPPGYMLVLGFMSWIDKLIGRPSADLTALLVKIPCIIADLVCAFIAYRIARKTMNRTPAVALLALVAFTPVMAYVSSAWGQIDQVLTLMLIVPIILLYDDKPILAGLVYGLGIIMKPQALMCGPLFAAAYIMYIARGSAYNRPFSNSNPDSSKRVTVRLLKTITAVVAAFAVIILISIPFRGEQGPFWLVEKYYGTATSYDYATVNAYNFWALIGANWKKVDVPFMGLTYGKWGTIFMAIFVVSGIALYLTAVLKHKSCKGALPLTMAYMLAGIFTFGHYMHERYLFPALMLLILAYLYYNDRHILEVFMMYAVTMLVNCIAAFYYSKLFKLGLYWDTRIIFWCSLANVVLFLFFTWVTLDLVIRNKPKKGFNG